MDEEKLEEILRRRYSDCDSLGHRAADPKKGICNYCYRNLDNNYENLERVQLLREELKKSGELEDVLAD